MEDEKKYADEKLSDEQLDNVAGGSQAQYDVDVAFFQQLGYNMARTEVEDAYGDNGVKFDFNCSGDNSYRLLKSDGWTKHPHWAAMGYVLARKNYPGFDGQWWNIDSVKPFLKEHFHISDFG